MSLTKSAVMLYAWKQNFVTFRIVQGESNSRTLSFQLFESSTPLDLTSCNVRLYAAKPDNTKVYIDCIVKDAKQGSIEVTLTKQISTAAGNVECWINVVRQDNADLRFQGILLDVGDCSLDDAVESSNEFGALVTALNSVVPAVNAANAATQKASAAATNAAQAAVQANAAAQAAQAAIPVRGQNYWTPEDQLFIIQEVLNRLPTWEGGNY